MSFLKELYGKVEWVVLEDKSSHSWKYSSRAWILDNRDVGNGLRDHVSFNKLAEY